MTRPPLSARSVIASTLLGSDPPRLAGRLLVAIGEPFGIPRGTMRVALTRMVDRGELTNIDGTYKLRGELLQRKERPVLPVTTDGMVGGTVRSWSRPGADRRPTGRGFARR